ncbi:IS110 family transposase [Klebsiella pneumoniae]|uniref:IS110 family transposase n=1 Tax=Klebsiella pneumoniae TaxID=573 RepID=UPI001C88AF3E|nr:transposase [Klebsiella pneumoniae]
MIVAMEACGASHHWAREIQKTGHDVVMLPAQHVRAYQRRQKNDYNDAQAIAEACWHGTIRPVPVKTLSQQDEQTFLKCDDLFLKKNAVNQPYQRVNGRVWYCFA